VSVHFDRPPIDDTGFQSRVRGPWYFKTDGTGDCFPPLTPAGPVTHESILASIKAASTPQPITHAVILAAVERLPEHLDGPAEHAAHLCNALGVEVPVKRAPWEVAYEAWRDNQVRLLPERAWQAAVEWFVEQIEMHKRISGDDDDIAVLDVIRRRIMGQEQQL
jgi:hypothetical protein